MTIPISTTARPEMDRRLTMFARNTRAPALPDEVAECHGRSSSNGRGRGAGFWPEWGGAASFRRRRSPSPGGVTLAVAGSFVLLVGQVDRRQRPEIVAVSTADPLEPRRLRQPEVVVIPPAVVDD